MILMLGKYKGSCTFKMCKNGNQEKAFVRKTSNSKASAFCNVAMTLFCG